MNKTLEGMAREICLAIWDHDYTPRDPLHPDTRWLQAMKAAQAGARFLADNITDRMAYAANDTLPLHHKIGTTDMKRLVAAALRAAAEGET